MAEADKSMVDTGTSVDDPGPFTRTVLEYVRTMKGLVPAVKDPADWAPLADFVAVDEFERVGTFLEVQNWRQYTEMLTQWGSARPRSRPRCVGSPSCPASSTSRSKSGTSEAMTSHVVNSMTVFEFNEDGKICHLDVYLQQAR